MSCSQAVPKKRRGDGWLVREDTNFDTAVVVVPESESVSTRTAHRAGSARRRKGESTYHSDCERRHWLGRKDLRRGGGGGSGEREDRERPSYLSEASLGSPLSIPSCPRTAAFDAGARTTGGRAAEAEEGLVFPTKRELSLTKGLRYLFDSSFSSRH